MNRFVRLRQLSKTSESSTQKGPSLGSQETRSTTWSNWAQVATFIMVVFGYFYTVRPAFQNQLLQEQTAKLLIEAQVAQDKLDQTDRAARMAGKRLNTLNQELVDVQSKLSAANGLRDKLNILLESERKKEATATLKIEKGKRALAINESNLEGSQRRVLMTDLVAVALAVKADDEIRMLQDYLASYEQQYQKDEDGHFIDDQEKFWPYPYGVLARALAGAKEIGAKEPTTYLSEKLIEQYQTNLQANKASFECLPMSFGEVKARFLKEQEGVDAFADRALESELTKLKQEHSVFHRIDISPEFKTQFKSARRQEEVGRIVGSYWGQLIAARRTCGDKLLQFRLIDNGFGQPAPK